MRTLTVSARNSQTWELRIFKKVHSVISRGQKIYFGASKIALSLVRSAMFYKSIGSFLQLDNFTSCIPVFETDPKGGWNTCNTVRGIFFCNHVSDLFFFLDVNLSSSHLCHWQHFLRRHNSSAFSKNSFVLFLFCT